MANMGQGASTAITKWVDTAIERPWILDARCADHPELPWTVDLRPQQRDVDEMALVCAQCPVIKACAADAIAAEPGGFYAGVWLPWRSANETMDTRTIRTMARQRLKETCGLKRLR